MKLINSLTQVRALVLTPIILGIKGWKPSKMRSVFAVGAQESSEFTDVGSF